MTAASVPDFGAQLRFLRSPAAHAAYEPACPPVETVETHMSWVFLAGEHALKLKKTVRHPFLDFSTLALREQYCREELRLNARLAPGVYHGLLALQWQHDRLVLVPEGHLPAAGQTLDWLVLMRRLPAARMLDRLIAAGAVDADDIDALTVALVDFYRRAAPVELDSMAYVGRFERELALDRELLLRPPLQVPGAARALDRLDEALRQQAGLLRARAAAGRVVDGHGDLRPEHVCLTHPPVVIDCLEFNPLLRQVDVFDELAFLGLECEIAGAGWITQRLVERCAAALDDSPPPALLHLYAACRALLRARLAMAHLLDTHPRTPQKWPPLAQRYVAHALQSLDALDPAAIVSAAMNRGNP